MTTLTSRQRDVRLWLAVAVAIGLHAAALRLFEQLEWKTAFAISDRDVLAISIIDAAPGNAQHDDNTEPAVPATSTKRPQRTTVHRPVSPSRGSDVTNLEVTRPAPKNKQSVPEPPPNIDLNTSIRNAVRKAGEQQPSQGMIVFDPKQRQRVGLAQEEKANHKRHRDRQQAVDEQAHFEFGTAGEEVLIRKNGRCWRLKTSDAIDDPFDGLLSSVAAGGCGVEDLDKMTLGGESATN